MTSRTDRSQVHASRQYLAAIVDSSDDAIIGLNLDSEITSWNRGAERLYGYSAEEAIGRPVSIITPADRLIELPAIMQRLRRGETADHFPTVRARKNGQALDISLSVSLIKDETGAIIGFSTIARDITQRKKTEDALIQRNRELLTLYALSEIIHSHSSLEEAYSEIVEEICAATGFPIGAIAIYDEARQKIVFQGTRGLRFPSDQPALEAAVDESFSGVVVRTGKPLIETHALDQVKYRSEILLQAGARTFIGYPISLGQRVAGALILAHTDTAEISDGMGKWMESLANYTALLIERKRADQDLRRSSEQLGRLSLHLQSAIEEERKRIAREIHDELGQELSLLQLQCGMIEDRLPTDARELREKTRSMTNLIDTAILSVQRISTDLRPSLLDNLGIGAAIEWQAKEFQKRTKIACQATVEPADMKLDQDRSTALFRIFQETLTNVVRHAQATKVSAHLKKQENQVTLNVQDNGIGISLDRLADPKSFGLMGMRERVRVWGGSVAIAGSKGKGTEVTISLPLDA